MSEKSIIFNRPAFQVKTGVKVIDPSNPLYGARGSVSRLIGVLADGSECDFNDKTVYPECWKIEVKFPGLSEPVIFEHTQELALVQKKFIDIEALRDGDLELGTGVIRKANSGAFEPGDEIQITEKIDGANASVSWDITTNKLEIFSRTMLLSGLDGLRGFKTFIETQIAPTRDFKAYSNYVFFGEWLVAHKCQYDKSRYNHWYVYDIWDKTLEKYLPQKNVKFICQMLNLEYVHVLYEGPFESWDMCRKYLHQNTYGTMQEGIVIKNQTKLLKDNLRYPVYLKIVNDEFKETRLKGTKVEKNPEQLKLEAENLNLISEIVTEARVNKMILKLVDEGLLTKDLQPRDIGIIMKNLPKRIYEDCLKEEPEVLIKVGSDSGKLINRVISNIVKTLILK